MSGVSRIADELAAHIRTRILEGALVGGTQLPEASLASEYDVSRPTVRTAFDLLNADGLIVRRPHVPPEVRRVDEAELGEIVRLLEVCEELAVMKIVTDDEDVRDIRKHAGEPTHTFLHCVVGAAGSQRLVDLHRKSTFELLLGARSLLGSETPSALIGELVDALLVRDLIRARRALDDIHVERRVVLPHTVSALA